jgi:hypothetical protein
MVDLVGKVVVTGRVRIQLLVYIVVVMLALFTSELLQNMPWLLYIATSKVEQVGIIFEGGK